MTWRHQMRIFAAGRERLRQRAKELHWQQQLTLERCQARLGQTVVRLQSLNPLAVLERGYSITYRLPEERIVTSQAMVKLGQKVRVQLAEGALECLVEKKRVGTGSLREEMRIREPQEDGTL